MEVGKFVDRRLHPVRVALGLLNHEMELARGENVVSVDREVLRSVIETVTLFVEDFDDAMSTGRQSTTTSTKKFVTAAAQSPTMSSAKVG